MSVPVQDVACPVCNAQEGQACTRPTNTTRVPTTIHHLSRVELASNTEAPTPPATRLEVTAEAILRSLQADTTVSFIACDCGNDLEVTEDTTVEHMRDFLNHVAFEHSSRRPVNVFRTSPLLSGYELGVLLRLDPLTAAEREWRESRH